MLRKTSRQYAYAAAITPDCSTVAITGPGEVIQGVYTETVHVLDPWNDTPEVILAAPHQRRDIDALAISADGKLVLTGSGDNTSRIISVETGETLHVLEQQSARGITTVAFSPDATHCITGDDNGTALLWDVETGEKLLTVASPMIRFFAHSAFSPDGKKVALSGDNRIVTLDVDSLTTSMLAYVSGSGIEFSSDSRFIATSRGLFDVEENTLVRRFAPGNAHKVVFSDDQAGIYSAYNGAISYTPVIIEGPASDQLIADPAEDPILHDFNFDAVLDAADVVYPVLTRGRVIGEIVDRE
jgi:WD40 repeat protein